MGLFTWSLRVDFVCLQGYYSVHGRDATMIASIYYKTTACIRQLGAGAQTLASVCVSTTMFANIVRDLFFTRNMKVEVWSPTGGSKWSPTKYGSPGNVQVCVRNTSRHRSLMFAALVGI